MAEIIAERSYELQSGGNVVLRLFRPEKIDADWSCGYDIIWPDRQDRLAVFGIDAVQSLLLAMTVVHATLLASPESKSGDLTWLGEPDLGLPLASTPSPSDFP